MLIIKLYLNLKKKKFETMYLAQFEFIFILIFHFNITSDTVTILIFSSEMRNIKYAMIKCSNRVEAKKEFQ